MLVVEIDIVIGIRPAVGNSGFLCLAAFAVQYRLVNLDIAVDDDTVSGDFVARLKQNRVTDNDVVDSNLRDNAVSVHLAHNTRRFFLQFLERVFVSVLGEG